MRILITGGTGFIGSKLAEWLASRDEVYIVGRRNENHPHCKRCEYVSLDEINWTKGRFKNLDIVYHLAANNNTLDGNEAAMYEANIYSPIRMFHAAEYAGCKRFIYASSTAVYGNQPAPFTDTTPIDPLNVYARSKAKFDEFAMSFGKITNTNVVGLRFCNVYGPGEEHKGHRASMIYQIYSAFKENRKPQLFKDGEQKRIWLYVHDAVRILCRASLYEGQKIFNVGPGEPISFNEIINKFKVYYNKELEPEYIDNPNENNYQNYTECDIKPALDLLGWRPKWTFDDGLRASFGWWDDPRHILHDPRVK